METNSKKILESLPDFQQMLDLIEEIKVVHFRRLSAEAHVKELEAECFMRVMNDPNYFVNGRAVPVSYFENAYKQTGINGEIMSARMQLAELISDLEGLKNRYDVYKNMYEMWRTMSFTERSSV